MTMIKSEKTYSAKSSAARAGKKLEGFAGTEEQADGTWCYLIEEKDVIPGFSHCPFCGEHLSNGVMHADDEIGETGETTRRQEGATKEWECMACGQEFGADLNTTMRDLFASHGVFSPRNLCRGLRSVARDFRKIGASRKSFIEACDKLGLNTTNAAAEWQSSKRRAD